MQKYYRFFPYLGLVAFFFVIFSSAAASGKKQAESLAVLGNTESLTQALDFFYADQDRLPSASEFLVSPIFYSYLSKGQVADFKSEVCVKSYDYKFIGKNSAELIFCLNSDVKPYKKGWNQISIKKP